MSGLSLDSLEEKFRRVEEASERRPPEPSQSELVDPTGAVDSRRHHHRKQSVSISRFGQCQDDQGGSPSTSMQSPLTAVASKSTFYHTLAHPRSWESLVSEASEDETHRLEDNQQVTQVDRIAGRQTLPKTMGAMLPRSLSRAQSQTLIVPTRSVVTVDISVEKTTAVASHTEPDGRTSIAYATKPLRPRASTLHAQPSGGNLMERAKYFARKLQRKSATEQASNLS